MLIMVKWLDILGEDQSPWSTLDEAKELKPAPITSIGKLLEDNDEYLTIAASWDDESELVGNVNCIPKGVIREVSRVGVVDPDQNSGNFGEKI